MVILRRILLICASGLAVLAPSASALDSNRNLTQYLHRIWQPPQGLPQASIRGIFHASDGYLWLGTTTGVERFDGTRFTPLPGMESQEVEQILEDANHSVWIATTHAGLFQYSNGHLRRFSDSATHLALDPNGQIWAATSDAIIKIANNQITRVANVTATALAFDPRGRLWIGSEGAKIQLWDGAHLTPQSFTNLPAEATIQALLWTPGNTLWIGTSNGLLRVQNHQHRLFTKSDGLAGNSILSLSQGSDGTVWIGASEGFSRAKGHEIESFGAKQGLSQSTVYAITEDSDGGLWVGTKRGLNQFIDRRIIPFTTAEGLPTNDVGPVFEDARGILWVGTIGSGLARKTHNHFTVISQQQGLSSNTVLALAGDTNGLVWVGTDTGLDLWSGDHLMKSLTTADGLPSDGIRTLHRDRRGALWVGTTSGIAVVRDGRVTALPAVSPVVSFAEDGQGKIYAATEGSGVIVFNIQTLKELGPKYGPRDASTLFSDATDGSIFAGTIGNGLFLLKNGKTFHFTTNDGLFDDDIYGIAPDNLGNLWMACSKGIFSVIRADLDKFAAGSIKKIPSTPFSPLDGLQTVECKSGVQPAAWKLADGRIAFSTIRGLLIVDPSHMDLKLTPPRVAIEAVVVDGQNHKPEDIGDLPPANRNLEFRYTGLSFKYPLRTTFRYTLEGFNHEWIDAGPRREAYYTNLPHGHYRFRVKACMVDGACDAATTDISFSLAARFYQRVWFWPAFAGLLAIAAWLGYELRVQNLRGQFALVLSERNRIARELHDTLLQGFSGVTMQLQALAGRLPSQQRTALDEIIQDSADCLKEARRSVANLRNPRSGLAGAIAKAAEQAQGRGSSGARIKLKLEQVPAGLPDHVEYNLLKIAQEALSNAARHSGARSIEVALRPIRNHLRLSIRDNGSGTATRIEAQRPLPAAPNKPGTSADWPPAASPSCACSSKDEGHFGLIGMKERAEHIGADFQLSSVPGIGTTITIVLPLSQKEVSVHGLESLN